MEVELRTVLEWWTATWTWRRWDGRESGWWPDMASSDRPDDDVVGLCDTNNGKVIFSSDMPLCIFIPRTITLMTTFVLCWTVRPLTHPISPHIYTHPPTLIVGLCTGFFLLLASELCLLSVGLVVRSTLSRSAATRPSSFLLNLFVAYDNESHSIVALRPTRRSRRRRREGRGR